MNIKFSALGITIAPLLTGCPNWGQPQQAAHPITLYADVELTEKDIIAIGEICQIDQKMSGGKIYAFHKIECQNGKSGYVFIGGIEGRDERAFEPVTEASASKS
jgi:hypothetical protein